MAILGKEETERTMDAKKSEVLQGTLDLMILKTLHALGPLHGFGIAILHGALHQTQSYPARSTPSGG